MNFRSPFIEFSQRAMHDPALRPDRWTVRDILDRVAEVGDLFAPAQTDAQVLPEV